ncbi:hypothetical protein LBMAG56_22040 [Verrucomicrobiota bacterium]|nr:hypothetical protein LBMAG56_22040 [Verrucomicrobiota bacterium]
MLLGIIPARVSVLTAVLALAAAPLPAAEVRKPIEIAKLARTTTVDFEKEILPLLKRNCLACHNQTKAEEKLVLETPKDILKGGESGPAVVAGNPDKSLLLQLSSHAKKPIMPPAGNKAGAANLTPQELGLVQLWIQQGAKGEVKGNQPIAWQPLPEGLNPIYAVALTPDGQYAAAGRANQIFIYHVPSGELVTRLTDDALLKDKLYAKRGVAHRDMTYSLAFSPDGTLLASGSYREIKLWRRPANVQKSTFALTSPKPVEILATSADGKWLASADGNTVKLLDATSGKEARTLTGHTNAVTSLQFSPDNTKLLSGSNDKSAKVWNVADGAPFADVPTPSEVTSVAWVSAGKQIATGGADNLIRLWKLPDAAKGAATAGKELKGHTKAVTALASVAPDGAQLLSGSADASVRLWTVETAACAKQHTHDTPVTAPAVRPDGKMFASLGQTNTAAKLWSLPDGKAVADVKGDRYVADAAAAVEREATFAASEVTYQKGVLKTSEDSLKKEQEAAKKAADEKATLEKTLPDKKKALAKAMEEKAAADKPAMEATAAVKKATDAKEAADKAVTALEADSKAATEKAAKAKDAEKVAADKAVADLAAKLKAAAEAKTAADKALTDATAKQKEAADKLAKANKAFVDAEMEVKKYTNAEEQQQLADKSAKKAEEKVAATKAAITKAEATQKAADAAVVAAKKTVTDAEKNLRTLAFSPDNKTLATAGDDGIVRTWSAETGAPFENFRGHAGVVSAVTFTKDGALLSTGADKKAIIWNLAPEWKLERTIGSSVGESALIGRVNALAFSADGKSLASGSGEPSRSGELKIWNPATGALIREIKNAHSDAVLGVEFSSDGTLLGSGAADKFVKVFTVADGKLVKSFEGHTHQVLGVSWKRDGRTLVSAGADNAVKVWNLETGEVKRTVAGFTKEATSIVFVGVTDQFLTTGGDSKVRLVSEAGSDVRTFPGATDFMYASAVKPDGKIVVAGGQDGVLRIWNGTSGAVIAAFSPPEPAPTAPAVKAN